MKKHLLIIGICLLAGCSSVSTIPRPSNYYQSPRDAQAGSLFDAKNASLQDKEIARLLTYQFSLPKQIRIAVLNLSAANIASSSVINDKLKQNFFERLRQSKNVYDASYLPGLLVPEKRNIDNLREAAARYQADLLLVYRKNCYSFENYGLFTADKSKAYCSIEAAVLDTRSGIIPFTSVATRQLATLQNNKDINFAETMRKNEFEASTEALTEIADNLVQFLSAVSSVQN